MSNLSTLWVERYRPKTIKDIVMPKDFKRFFSKLVADGQTNNLLLSSPTPGTGKSTLAKALVNDLGADYIYINASSENSIDVIRNQIHNFAMTKSFVGGTKVVILDEADGLTPQFQKALRAFIEEFEKNCRFILTCNYISKIIPALRQGRTMVFDFNMAKYKDELIPQIVKRLEGILKFEKVEFDETIIPKLVETNFPSLRECIATLQQYAQTHGKIDEGILTFKDVGSELSNLLIEKKLTAARQYIEQQGLSYSDVFKNLFENFVTSPKCVKKGQAIILLADYEYRCSFSSDPSLQEAACMYELMGCL